MKVMLVGAGYVGIAMACILSKKHSVTLLEIDKSKVDMINEGKPPIYEEGASLLLSQAVAESRIKARCPSDNVGKHDIILICVGTPSTSEGFTNLSFIQDAIDIIFQNIDEFCDDYCVFGIKSTVPPGTTRRLNKDRVHQEGLSNRIGVVSNPEFLSEGSAIENAMNPDRIVIGTEDDRAFEELHKMYEGCFEPDKKIYVRMSFESSELCKYVSNCFLATKISFANEVADLTEKIPSSNIDDVMYGVGLDKRISPSFFGSGAGWGGSCLPKDIAALIQLAKSELAVKTPILEAMRIVNDNRPPKIVDMLGRYVDFSGKKVTILGLTFKPNTNDIRNSPSLSVIDLLYKAGAKVWLHDPMIDNIDLNHSSLEKVHPTGNIEESLSDAYGCILMTSWDVYKEKGIEHLTRLMRNKVFIDGRRLFSKDVIPEDVTYWTVGMATAPKEPNM